MLDTKSGATFCSGSIFGGPTYLCRVFVHCLLHPLLRHVLLHTFSLPAVVVVVAPPVLDDFAVDGCSKLSADILLFGSSPPMLMWRIFTD